MQFINLPCFQYILRNKRLIFWEISISLNSTSLTKYDENTIFNLENGGVYLIHKFNLYMSKYGCPAHQWGLCCSISRAYNSGISFGLGSDPLQELRFFPPHKLWQIFNNVNHFYFKTNCFCLLWPSRDSLRILCNSPAQQAMAVFVKYTL